MPSVPRRHGPAALQQRKHTEVERTLSSSNTINVEKDLTTPKARQNTQSMAMVKEKDDGDVIVVEDRINKGRQTASGSPADNIEMERRPHTSNDLNGDAATPKAAPRTSSNGTQIPSQIKRKRNALTSSFISDFARQPQQKDICQPPHFRHPAPSVLESDDRSVQHSAKRASVPASKIPPLQSSPSFSTILPPSLTGPTRSQSTSQPRPSLSLPTSVVPTKRSFEADDTPRKQNQDDKDTSSNTLISLRPSALPRQAKRVRQAVPTPAKILRARRPKLPDPTQEPTTSMRDLLLGADWTAFDPQLKCLLFQLEFAQHGLPTRQQARGCSRAFKLHRSPPPPRMRLPPRPTWETNFEDVKTLVRKMAEREHFVAALWARDIIGRYDDDDDSSRFELFLRRQPVAGVDVYLVGKEFPLNSLIIVGQVVGITEKDDRLIYDVDDGTGVVGCVCPLPEPRPSSHLPPDARPDTKPATPKKRKVEEAEEISVDSRLEVGTLVRVVGNVHEAMYTEQDRYVMVEKIEHIMDVNEEVEHHLAVAELHRSVYSQPFDLRKKLDEVKQAEAERWAHLGSSQASSSAAGSPKKVRWRRPAKLNIEDITLANFILYIRQHLRNHHLVLVEPQQSRHYTHMLMSGQNPEPVELPQAFSLDDITSNRDLALFATRLAQKTERDRRARKKQSAAAASRKKGDIWVRQDDQNLQAVITKGVGSRGGSTLLLPSVTRTTTSSSLKSEQDDAPLAGEKLTKAVSKQFREALIQMRQKGSIVVSSTAETDKVSWFKAPAPAMEELPDLPSYSKSNARDELTSDCGAADFGDQDLSAFMSRGHMRRMKREPSTPPEPTSYSIYAPTWSPSDSKAGPVSSADVSSISNATADRTDASWTTSVAGVSNDTYELVTAATVAQPILRVLRNQSAQAKLGKGQKSALSTPSWNEKDVRIGLTADERWEAVARYSEVVAKGLELLKQQDLVQQTSTGGFQLTSDGMRRWTR